MRERQRDPGARRPLPALRRQVLEGRVACPGRGWVDVVACFTCPYSGGLSVEHEERVVCTWFSDEAAPAEARTA
jgi:hypothetical protein